MSGIIARWTTPSILYKPSQVGVSDIEDIFVALKQRGVTRLVKGIENASVTEDGFLWGFTQEETGLLHKNAQIEVQIDYKTATGQRYTTRPLVLEPMNSAVDGVVT